MKKLDRWQQVGVEEARVVRAMTLRNELSGGTPTVRAFEANWRKFTGLKYAITVCNGTASLYSAFFGLRVGPGDEVICPTYTWISTISPVPLLGARPVFAECVRDGIAIDPRDIRRRITKRTKAIVVVHLWGWPCDMDAIMAISRETGIPVVEDCSHAHGALHRGRVVGSIGRVGCWSLQGTKPLSAGEAGIIATNDSEVFDRACLIGQVNRMVGMDLVTNRYQYLQPLGTGMKFRAHPLGVGIASVQHKKLAVLNKRRARFVKQMEKGLADIPCLKTIATPPGSVRGGYYGFPVLYDPAALGGVPRGKVIEAISAEGVPVSEGFYELLHRLPYFRDGFDVFGNDRGPLSKTNAAGFDRPWSGYKDGDFPVTEAMHARLLFLPMLSDPVPNAAAKILEAIWRGVSKAGR